LNQQEQHTVFTGLIREYERMIFKVCFMYTDNPEDREDLYQEIVLQAWKGYKNFRAEAKFSTWLYQVSLNTAITGFKKSKRSPLQHTADGGVSEIADVNDDYGYPAQLHSAIAQLNEIEKAIVMLYLDSKPYEEMQEILGIATGALRVKMTRIKEKLRTITKNN